MALKIEQRIGIAAPVDDVYDLVADINAWPQWSPIHKAASAEMHFGAPVHLEEYYAGLGTWEIDGILTDWAPLSHLHVAVPKPFYAGTLIRYFEFESLIDTGSTFTIGALFQGFLSEREGKRYKTFLRQGFEAFNAAVKAEAEARFAAAPERARVHVDVKPPEAPQLGPRRPDWTPTQFLFFGNNKKKF